jgi:hypothetical protein
MALTANCLNPELSKADGSESVNNKPPRPSSSGLTCITPCRIQVCRLQEVNLTFPLKAVPCQSDGAASQRPSLPEE